MTTKKDTKQIEVQERIEAPGYIMPNLKGEAELLISQAIDKNVPVETMEKLLAMRRELKAEKAKEEYDRAMAEFQKECPTIQKTTQGYNYKYADLTTIIEQVKELLSKKGFSYTFDTDEISEGIIVYCKVKHIGGHMEVSKAQIKRETTTKMNASQQSGAAMTYGKRYAFVNAFGILTGDEDTDAVSTQVKPQKLTREQLDNPVQEEIPVSNGQAARYSNGLCSSCHAPTGKIHSSKCPYKI